VWDTIIQPGDIMVFDPAGTPEIIEIESAVTHHSGPYDTFDLVSKPSKTYTNAAYEIRRRFQPNDKLHVDWVLATGDAGVEWLILTDGTHGPFKYDGTTLDLLALASPPFTSAVCCTYANNSLFVANTEESGSFYRCRIRWSSPTDIKTFAAQDYVDLDFTPGQIIRMLPMGPLLIVYLTDSIYVGRLSNLMTNAGDVIPYIFTRIDTGNMGLVGMKAVTSWLDGHFFAANDDLYYLTPQLALQSFGSVIKSATMDLCQFKHEIRVVAHPDAYSIVVGMPALSAGFDALWNFNYLTKAWSKMVWPTTVSAIANMNVYSDGPTWADIDSAGYVWDNNGATDIDKKYSHWTSMCPQLTGMAFVGGLVMGGGIAAYAPGHETDDCYFGSSEVVTNIDCFIESPSLDFDSSAGYAAGMLVTASDDVKTVYRYSMKLKDGTVADMPFALEVMTEPQDGWRSVGDLVIEDGEDEGKVDFRATGDNFHFRFHDYQTTEKYTIIEMGMRVKIRAYERRHR
jgi:hypothetical protein